MQTNRYKYFRWTARTGWLTVAYVVAFPAFIGYLGIVTDVSETFLVWIYMNREIGSEEMPGWLGSW